MKRALSLLVSTIAFADQIDIYHGFQGFLGEKFSELIARFEEKSEHTVRLRAFDDYNDIVAQGLKDRPHLMFGYETSAATLVDSPDLIPVSFLGVMRSRYVDSIAAFYSNAKGELVGMPFNISTGVLFYNKAAFRKAGLDPERPPSTWIEMERALEKLSSARCGGFTTAWPAAYHVEHLAALHAAPLATNNNGFSGEPRLTLNQEVVRYHLSKVLGWQRRGLFIYAGQKAADAEQVFAEGKCAILLQGANRYGLIERAADFEIGVGPLPYWPQFASRPYTLNTGGAALWAFKQSDDNYKAVRELLAFLSTDETAQWWHETTGYLPVMRSVARSVIGQGVSSMNPAARFATEQVFCRPSSPYSVGLRFLNYVPVRICLMDNIEKMFAGELSPEQVLTQTERFAHPDSKL